MRLPWVQLEQGDDCPRARVVRRLRGVQLLGGYLPPGLRQVADDDDEAVGQAPYVLALDC